MWAMIVKELRQVRRDHRTLAMMLGLPVLLLVVFGYAASFDVSEIRTEVVGPAAQQAADALPSGLDVVRVEPDSDRADAQEALRAGDATVAVVADPSGPKVLVDGSDLFAARAAVSGLAAADLPFDVEVEVLFNPELETAAVMVPAIVGLILVFVGTLVTSLGVVRERSAGTLEQLAVMPLRARDVIAGKVAPYFGVAAADLVIVTVIGVALFDVPFRGSVALFGVGALLFLLVTLGVGVLISTVSQNAGQAIQLSMMFTLPQVLLSGMVFPLAAMAAGVRWIAYLLPLTYYVEIARGIMVRGAPFSSLAWAFGALAVMAAVVFTAAIVRFRRDLGPGDRGATGDLGEVAEASA